MQASKPYSSTTAEHFFGPPATPTARQPWSFAIWPTAEPTAPEAAETTTVSPSLGRPSFMRPKYAVTPGMPHTPSAVDGGGESVTFNTGCRLLGSRIEYFCQPP